MFEITLEPWVIAMAMKTAEDRPRNVRNPSTDKGHPDADLSGAMAEYAYAQHYGFPWDTVTSDGNDPGWDFCHGIWVSRRECDGTTVDVKSSPVHPDSWVVKPGELTADWFVFAYVIIPDRVIFKAKAPREWIEPKGIVARAGMKRLVYQSEVQDFDPEDFPKAEDARGEKPNRQSKIHPGRKDSVY